MGYVIKNSESILLNDTVYKGDIRIREGVISELGQDLPIQGDELIDARGCVIYPGLVNTHHHLAQSVLKGVPEGLNKGLGEWLAAVPYRFWPKISPRLMYLAAKLGLYELQFSGATTCADHHYLYHYQSTPEIEGALWCAARDMGMRFMLCRGSATSLGSHKGVQSMQLEPETPELVMQRIERSLNFHDPDPLSMSRVCMAPTSLIHSCEPAHLKEFAQFARQHQLKMHSHLLEVNFDEEQSQSKYGMSAVEYAASCDWLGEDVWFAHMVHTDKHARALLAESNTSISHCPTSNCRLGSGIAEALDMDSTGIKVTMGVDGSASSESGSMLQELNLAWLLHRSQHGADAIKLNQVMDWGSKHGADLLGFKSGRIEVGYAADLVLYRIDSPRMAMVHSPEWAPVLCGEPATVEYSFIQGRPVIAKQESTVVDIHQLISDLRQEMARFMATI
ncbi:amidohydrolase family protein [Vibrio maerlii]|uniref:amidohydrolase family protein n=1 Tax=Vibrio maerlii TaxID=2231648 RepID=UPI000E3DD02E|nr:amidohydrolase family protein [Vibrio maerlii]